MLISPATPPADAAAFFATSPLFQGASSSDLAQLAAAAQWLYLPGGSILFRRNDVADSAYFVFSGRLQVYLETDAGFPRVLRDVVSGENVGELGMLIGGRRSASVRAVRDAVLARISFEYFATFLHSTPLVMSNLVRLLATWLARMNEPEVCSAAPRTIAVVLLAPLNEETVNEFIRCISPPLSLIQLTATDAERTFGSGAAQAEDESPKSHDIAHWMDRQEKLADMLLLVTDAASNRWAKRCIRQADRILVFADSRSPPEEISSAILATAEQVRHRESFAHLCLVHPRGTILSRDTRRWLCHNTFAAHHHVRTGCLDDFARLSRHLRGRANGLVLGGGGARAYAHIGVIRAMQEMDIPIDCIAGTSMGAFIAAQHALGRDWAQIARYYRRAWSRRRPATYTLPIVSLMSSSGAEQWLRDAFGEAEIEDFWIPFFCVSTNLSKALPVIHADGPAYDAIRASAAIPGIFPPSVSSQGDLLVDGAITNNLPGDLMRHRGAKRVIGVHVSTTDQLTSPARFRKAPGPVTALLDLIRKLRRERFPAMAEIIQQAVLISSIDHANRVSTELDLYLTPPVEMFGMFHWSRVEEIAQVGYEYAAPRLAQWKTTIES